MTARFFVPNYTKTSVNDEVFKALKFEEMKKWIEQKKTAVSLRSRVATPTSQLEADSRLQIFRNFTGTGSNVTEKFTSQYNNENILNLTFAAL